MRFFLAIALLGLDPIIAMPTKVQLGPCKTCRIRPSQNRFGECNQCARRRNQESSPVRRGLCRVCGETKSRYWHDQKSLCPKCRNRIKNRKFREENSDLSRALTAAWQKANLARRVAYNKSWRNGPGSSRFKENRRRYLRRIRSDVSVRIHHRIGCDIRRALSSTGTKRGRRWEDMLGWTSEQLKARLESLFSEGMNWDRFMAGEIEIDHITPKAYFRFSSPEDEAFRQCWAITNLRPEWSDRNLAKSSWHAGKRWTYKDHLQRLEPAPQIKPCLNNGPATPSCA